MAERRMFTKKVTDDDSFMSLSSSAQALYLHLSMSADDDGFCNQVSLSMFKAHASVQDLESLLNNRYIYQFENGVIVIKDWRMANALRKDRYTPTVFQDELSKLRLNGNGQYDWLPSGCQDDAKRLPQDRIGQDREEEDRLGKVNNSLSESMSDKRSDKDELIDMWNALETYGIKPIRGISEGSKRMEMVRARLRQYTLGDFETAIDNIRQSDFLQGKVNDFVITFDWFIKPNNFIKVLEGNYEKRPDSNKPGTTNKVAQQLYDSYQMMSEWANNKSED